MQGPAATEAAATDAGTALATASSVAAAGLSRTVQGFNAQMYLGLVGNALKEPLPSLDTTELAKLPLAKHRDHIFSAGKRYRFDSSLFFLNFSVSF